MFDTKHYPPKNEFDVKLAEIELEKIKEITKQLPEYMKAISPMRESGHINIDIGDTRVTIELMRMCDYV